MKRTIVKKVEKEFVEDIICNKCGNSCRPPGIEDFYGLIEVGFSTGYFSPAFPDGVSYTFSMCEKCLKEIFDTFKIKPQELPYII
jgi:hypothetical protein